MLAWSVGDDAAAPLAPVDEQSATPEPTGMTTGEGIDVGSSRDELRAAFTDEQVLDGFDDGDVDVFIRATGDAPPMPVKFVLVDDIVTGIGAGPPDCLSPSGDR
jgi:hypothetical protein